MATGSNHTAKIPDIHPDTRGRVESVHADGAPPTTDISLRWTPRIKGCEGDLTRLLEAVDYVEDIYFPVAEEHSFD